MLAFAPVVFAQSPTSINFNISSPVPDFTLTVVGEDGLRLDWSWDTIAIGYIPPSVTQMDIELATDGLNYFNLQSHNPADFSTSYSSLAGGTYTARVTIIDGNDYSYVVGPVNVGTSGGGSSHGGGGSIGGDGGGTTSPIPPPVQPPDITLSGLAYPGPTSIVIFTHDGSFQATVTPDSFGDFVYQTMSLPAGGATFAFSAQDPDGNLSAPVSFFYTVSEGQTVVVDTIYLPPTLTSPLTVIPVGDDLQLSGYGYRDGGLLLTVQGVTSSAILTQADSDGRWSVNMPTNGLVAGTYSLIAVSTSSDASIVSPDSSSLTFELVDVVAAPPVCGDGIVDPIEACDDGNTDDGDGCSSLCLIEGCGDGVVIAPEQCDDGNLISGDGCDDLCALELSLPDTIVDQVSPSVFSTSTVDLTYQILQEPNGSVTSVELYYSLDSAPYVKYNAVFSGGVIQLSALVDGVYEVYSLGRDSAGFLESAPLTGDATFTVDAVKDFDVLAYPEKRVPSTGNWALTSTLDLYELGQITPKYHYDLQTDDQGLVKVDIDETFDPAPYDAVLKGSSHLSKRLDLVDMTVFNDLVLDFTESNTFFLLSGDVHSSKDDYVNSLDISAILGMLYSSNINGDLNVDTSVNALDLSMVMRNLHKSGDGSR